jgi:hypothetical protein
VVVLNPAVGALGTGTSADAMRAWAA